MHRCHLIWLVVFLPFLVFAGPARAEDQPEARAPDPDGSVSAAVLVGGGVTIGGANLHGFGGGVRAGYTFSTPFYVGALALFHWGSSDPGEPDVRHHAQDVGAEAGYAFRFAPVVILPTLRGGMALVTTPRDVDGEFFSPHLGFGVTVVVEVDNAFFGIDADTRLYTRLVNNGDNAYSNLGVDAYAVGGIRY